MLVGLRVPSRSLHRVSHAIDARWIQRGAPRPFCNAATDLTGPDSRKGAAESMQPQPTFASPIIQVDDSVAAARRKRARPLSIVSELLLYQSSVDVQGISEHARRNCILGGGLAMAGFGTFLASVAPSMPPAMLLTLLSGAIANCYALSVIAQRVLRNLAARHVEQMIVLPTPVSEGPRQEKDAPLHELFLAATAEENLAVTQELRLEIRTACATHWVTLVDLEDDEASFGDDIRRASFGDLCSRLRVLHVDVDTPGVCPDIALLTALVGSPKVVAEDRREPRDDIKVAEGLRVAEGMPLPGPMLSDLTVDIVEEGHKTVSPLPPVASIEQIGQRARNGGIAILLTGGLFALGESARDADGVARWHKLKLPI